MQIFIFFVSIMTEWLITITLARLTPRGIMNSKKNFIRLLLPPQDLKILLQFQKNIRILEKSQKGLKSIDN